jgi:hypothetical protein
MNDKVFADSLGPELDKATAEIIKKTNQFKVTETVLEIKTKGGDGQADIPASPDGKEYPDHVVYITLYEPKKGKKRASVSGDFPLEAWADIMKHLKSVL